MKRKGTIGVSLALVAAMGMAGCGSSSSGSTSASAVDSSSAASSASTSGSATASASVAATSTGGEVKDGEYNILFMPKLTNIPYFQETDNGAVEEGKELGVNVIVDGPTTADAAQQVTMLENYISQGVDAICVAPNDPEAVTTVLKKARDAGILVLDWDTQADPSVTDASVYNVVDKDYGEHFIDNLVDAMGTDEADIAIITGGLSAANLNAWIDAGENYMKEKYPKLNLVTDPVASDESQDKAYQQAKEIMTAYPNVKGILGYSSPTGPGIGKAIYDMGLQDQVTVVAQGMEADIQDVLENGGLDVGSLWDCDALGRLTVDVATYMLKNDGKVPQDGESIEGNDDPVISDGSHNIYLTKTGTDYRKK